MLFWKSFETETTLTDSPPTTQGCTMLKFYYSGAPNPTKVALFLEESGIPYDPIPVDTRKGEQHKPEYLTINPNAKVPAVVDGDTIVFDSNAILLYLAEKTGKFLPENTPKARGELLSRRSAISGSSTTTSRSGNTCWATSTRLSIWRFGAGRGSCPTYWARTLGQSSRTSSAWSTRSARGPRPSAPHRSRTSTGSRRRWTRLPSPR